MASSITPHIEGIGRIMTTNGGTHPPEFWAQVTAEQVVQIGNDVVGARRIAALTLLAKVQAILESHHGDLHEAESGGARAAQEAHPDAVGDEAAAAVADIVEAAKGSEWEAHYAKPEVQAAIHFEVARMFASHQHVERSHHLNKVAN